MSNDSSTTLRSGNRAPTLDAALQQEIQADVTRALAEDLGGGDLSAGLIDPERRA